MHGYYKKLMSIKERSKNCQNVKSESPQKKKNKQTNKQKKKLTFHTNTLGLMPSLSQSTQQVPGSNLKPSSSSFDETISSPSNAATRRTSSLSGSSGSFNMTTSPTNTDLQKRMTECYHSPKDVNFVSLTATQASDIFVQYFKGL
jgi:hypothetical protein